MRILKTIIVICIVYGLPGTLLGASIVFDIPDTVPAGTVRIPVMLENEEYFINTIGGAITVDDFNTPIAIRTGDSLIPIWIQAPEANGQTVTFSGVIPGSIRASGTLFTLVLSTKEGDELTLRPDNIELFLGDGTGTTAPASSTIRHVRVTAPTEDAGSVTDDRTPPLPFTPVVGSDPSLFNEQYFVAFAAQDKESGVAYYEIQERLFGAPDPHAWHEAVSPYELTDQYRFHHIFVKAVDHEGNVRIAHISPQSVLLHRVAIPFLAGILIIMLTTLVFLYRRYANNIR